MLFFGIINLPLVPLRKEPCECSEMVSQLLFGEVVELLLIEEKWLKIRNLSDNYEAWADRKMIVPLSVAEKQKNDTQNFVKVSDIIFRHNDLLLPFGSILHTDCYCERTLSLFCGDGEALVSLAKKFLYAPYLWGGKSVFGIDCSGLAQVVFSVAGINLPRDASQQALQGEKISSLHEAQAGDLAFFGEQKITHVGILIDNQTIIHSSGWVKIEKIDEKGIISAKNGEYTHRLCIIKRNLTIVA